YPPPRADKQKPVILQEFGRLAFEIMSDELKYPAENKESNGETPEARNKKRRNDQHQREHDHWYPKRVHQPVHWVLMTFRVFIDPLVPGSATHHSLDSSCAVSYIKTVFDAGT